MPIIITGKLADPVVRQNDWDDQSGRADELPRNVPYDAAVWDYFQWNMDDRYRGETCVNIHRAVDGILSFHLVQPIHYEGDVGTFARRLAWPIIWNLGRHWNGMVRNVGPDQRLDEAHEALMDNDYLTGWNVYAKLGN